MDEWETIIPAAPVSDADAQWRKWLEQHDITEINLTDVRIDTGRAERGDFRRYLIRKSVMAKIKLGPVRER